MLKNLSLFLMAYNEEKNIEKAIADSLDAAKKVAHNYEVIVVLYGGSTDRTREIVERIASHNKKVRLVIQKLDNKGYGAGLRTGIRSSRYDYIFYTDADNQFDMNDLKKLIPYLKHYDIVQGRRTDRKDSMLRIIAAKIYNLGLKIMFGDYGVNDVDCAFKVYKKRIFDKIKIKCNSGVGDAEIIIKAKRLGYRIKEVPIRHKPRTKGDTVYASKIGMIKLGVIKGILKDVRKLWNDIYKAI